MKQLINAIEGFVNIKQVLAAQFLQTVQDKNIHIFERLQLWEKHAEDILPVGNWYSNAPAWLAERHDGSDRNSVIRFTDLLESLEDEVEFTKDDKPIGITDEGREKLEQVFSCGYSSTHYDW